MPPPRRGGRRGGHHHGPPRGGPRGPHHFRPGPGPRGPRGPHFRPGPPPPPLFRFRLGPGPRPRPRWYRHHPPGPRIRCCNCIIYTLQCLLCCGLCWLFRCGCYAEDDFGYQPPPNDRNDPNRPPPKGQQGGYQAVPQYDNEDDIAPSAPLMVEQDIQQTEGKADNGNVMSVNVDNPGSGNTGATPGGDMYVNY